MDILIACEESQTVCSAFRNKGHNAFSCDILDPSGGHPEWHIKGDAIMALYMNKWDIVIAFPPCTDLAVSGAKHFAQKKADGRQQASIDFFMRFANYKGRIAIENPVGIMSSIWRKPDQIVQPYMFGDPFTKTTCLWLNGLPLLKSTNLVDKGARHVTSGGNSLPLWYNLPPSPDRARQRSKTFPGIAQAMADQWG